MNALAAGTGRRIKAFAARFAALACGAVLIVAAVAAVPLGEFDGQCVMSLAEGKRISTDCSINWIGGDGRTYCFGSDDSRVHFLQDPEGNLQRAREFYAAGDVEATGKAMEHYQGDDVKAFTEGVIKQATDGHDGIFPLHDALTDQSLELVYEKIDFVRTLHGYGFFPEVIFHASDDPEKQYLVDFWVKPQRGQLAVMDVRIYKAPRKEGSGWRLTARLPKPWWWIPASEHPGETEQKRGWQVMSAVDEYIIGERARRGGLYQLKDDKTGEEIALEFIGIHQPVRRLQGDGRYFACTDFRRKGTQDQIYDVDFWLDEKDGRISVGDVRIHKVPVQQDGSWTQVPRYNFDGLDFKVVP